MDKLTLGFIADVLYLKGIICFEEFEDIQDITHASDFNTIIDKMIGGKYNVYKRGEGYVQETVNAE